MQFMLGEMHKLHAYAQRRMAGQVRKDEARPTSVGPHWSPQVILW